MSLPSLITPSLFLLTSLFLSLNPVCLCYDVFEDALHLLKTVPWFWFYSEWKTNYWEYPGRSYEVFLLLSYYSSDLISSCSPFVPLPSDFSFFKHISKFFEIFTLLFIQLKHFSQNTTSYSLFFLCLSNVNFSLKFLITTLLKNEYHHFCMTYSTLLSCFTFFYKLFCNLKKYAFNFFIYYLSYPSGIPYKQELCSS